ncbi:conserved hypothetical protein [Theileria equi strain WA]|uniref:Uncharacterized protein n=1 Tax=Theileria equi strain WA TaxID=1537102 RepID=L1LA73_THEEQ|nr:conserved hypothetical protein [Theileria equi strain WA]EKX72140.1 conserved hypothetical protein [Theileria equi strain WA]|eukprot:XP_004831592.1 conserved hypothetical protein [Theileria equi strain WA]
MKEEYEEEDVPLPYKDFKSFAKYQSDVLKSETDDFLKRHNLRLKKYILPSELPPWAKSFDEVLDTGKEFEPLTTVYRHKHFLKARILHNWSYIETRWNRSKDPRNKNIPFDLRPLTTEILNQLDVVNEDMLDPEFSGLLVTLNTYSYLPEEDGTTAKTADVSGSKKTDDPSMAEYKHGNAGDYVQKNDKESVDNAVPGKVYTAMHNLQKSAHENPTSAHSTTYMDMAIDKSLPVDVSIDINLEPEDDSLSMHMPVKNTYDSMKSTDSVGKQGDADSVASGFSMQNSDSIDSLNNNDSRSLNSESTEAAKSEKTLETCDALSTDSSDLDFILNSDASEETNETMHGELKRVKFANSSASKGNHNSQGSVDASQDAKPSESQQTDEFTSTTSEKLTDSNSIHFESKDSAPVHEHGASEATGDTVDSSTKHVKFVDQDEISKTSTDEKGENNEKRVSFILIFTVIYGQGCHK